MENDKKDEKKNKNTDDNKTLLVWGIILCVFGMPVVGIFLIAMYVVKGTHLSKSENQKEKLTNNGGRCPNCGANIKPNSEKCEYCDSPIPKK